MDFISKLTIGQLGLILDVVGVILLFYSSTDSSFLKLLSDTTNDELEKGKQKFSFKKMSKYQILAYCGLVLILIGFVFQFLETLKPKS